MAEGELPKYGLENKTVFYRSRFKVKPRYGIEAEVWPQIVRTLQLWLEEKEERRHDSGQPNLLTALTSNVRNFASIVPNLQVDCYLNTLFACGNIKEETNLSRIEVKAYFASEGDHIPEHWVMEYLEQDSQNWYRRWITNVGISRTKNHAYVVNVRIAIADDPAFIAARPWIPRRNTPRFIVDMLEIDGCLTCSGDTVLPTQAQRLSAQSMNRFIADLTSPNRTVPIIVVAALRGYPGVYPMSPSELARKLRGSAVVYAVDFSDYQVRQEYRKHFIPGEPSFKYRVNNGFARVYFPKVDLENADESKRHHFYTLDKLEQSNVEDISDDICGAITRLYQRKSGEALDFVSIEALINRAKRQDIEKRYRELQTYRREEKPASVDTTLLHTEEEFQSAIEELKTQIEKLSSDNEFYVQYIDELESESASQELDLDALELNDRIQSLEAECRQKESTIGSLKHSIREISQSNAENASITKAIARQATLIQTMSEFPRTAYDALELAKEAFGDRLIFLDEAVESARKFTSGEADETFDILRTVAVDLWPLYFGNDNLEGEIDKAYAARTGYELSFNESSMTNKDQKLRQLRLREYKGQTIDISPHIKGTQGKRTEPLRVHFYVDKNEKKIVIGHCGAHMNTAGTRKAKK